jgi:hypothetical protein
MDVNIETGSNRVAAIAAVIILIATYIYFDNWRWLLPGMMLALLSYGVVYFACVWILKGFTKQQKLRREVDKKS